MLRGDFWPLRSLLSRLGIVKGSVIMVGCSGLGDIILGVGVAMSSNLAVVGRLVSGSCIAVVGRLISGSCIAVVDGVMASTLCLAGLFLWGGVVLPDR